LVFIVQPGASSLHHEQSETKNVTMQHNGVSESNDFVGQESGSNLQDSEITIDSTDGEDNGAISNSGWLGSIGADFRSIANVAHCLTENVKPVVSGVAALVHRTAVAVANEIALLEQDGELDHSSGDNLESLQSSPSHSAEKQQHEGLMLPWEIRRELSSIGEDNIPVYFTDNDLMDTILALSSHESTFLGPFKNHVRNIDDNSFAGDDKQISLTSFSSTFVMDESRIDLIGRLMDIDKNLASEHSRFSGEFFWKKTSSTGQRPTRLCFIHYPLLVHALSRQEKA
jgi:hypothetical protein